jgi:drug/metabolite transporter (DMT)-like permease
MMGDATGTQAHARGVALCLASAVGFGLMAILAKEAFTAGVGVATFLTLRFAVAACAFWGIVAVRRPAWPAPRTILAGLGLGAVGYAAQSGLFFGALTHIDASLASLLLYTYPALVFVATLVLRHERADRRRTAALALTSGGAALVLLGGDTGALAPAGVVMALGAAVAYSAYILVADSLLGRIDPVLLSALLATGALASFLAYSGATGDLSLDFAARGWLLIVGVALLCTVFPITALMLGLPKVGPATASIVSTLEPVVTVSLAVTVLGERLALVQAVGGVLVVAAVVLLRARGKVRADGPSAELSAAPPARALA